MSKPLIKICGLSNEATVNAALEAGADMIGFVFFPKSPRHISLSKAKELSALVKGKATVVALTVNMENSDLEQVVEACSPDLIQLHGSETKERAKEVRALFNIPVMKAFGIAEKSDLDSALGYEDSIDRFLFDAKPPKDADLPGGNGVSFDWNILNNLELEKPWMLSGGLNPENVRNALVLSGALGVDVSSGVESQKGLKDIELIKTFVREATQANLKV
ncbi:phosphoribosylanthranilate isomerase [Flexibacterium corallicola]|uniref:phosphoribosylanthranilate isomerase n=1 Tax=Flexibacterium corallicola TaxID=3037259 RepID=UPI00286F35EE|nr:phosphoribosylanthranilate isomerase [Pseudovibrio sp. M1P-2-3]